jgi:hypothetical protein
MADGPTSRGGHVRSRDRTGTSVLSDRDRRSRSWRSAPGQVWLLSVVKRSRIARYEAFSICEGFRMPAAANGSARAGHLAGWPRNERRPGTAIRIAASKLSPMISTSPPMAINLETLGFESFYF